ncbi:MAG: bifunctional 5,10-methylenetetrahydrofolate dehydrogenase/5,10-methenyltetrahydrofolate cyclohydrolase [Deltaproteobacteria bacterium]|nr:bifunctional 5,10-methylenetetrahydrofolate dehydrogenase/5,10-methenyltetrahydrofolate cyclohydrolase [Deltaproteobacteria bacterium]
MKTIDGLAIARNIRRQVKEHIATLDEKPRFAVIQVGENEASSVYVASKLKACRAAGIETVSADLDAKVSQESLIGLIQGFNASPDFHGMLIQLPVPEHISVEAIIEAVDPAKDVDGFHPLNVGRLTVRSSVPYLHPCTPWGIVHMLDTVLPKREGVSGLRGKKVVVLGQSHIVGRPLSVMLQNEGATVTMCDIHTRDLHAEVAGADVLVSATGVKRLVDGALVDAVGRDDLIVVDAGIARDDDGSLCGDVDRAVHERLAAVTPVPGGVGPVTVAFLLRNILKAYCIQKGLPLPAYVSINGEPLA